MTTRRVCEPRIIYSCLNQNKLCRLCKGTEHLCNLDDDTSLLEKTNFCIDFKISQNDGLPAMICKFCKKMIKKFYTFKQNCLKVDLELKILYELREVESNVHTDIHTITDKEDSLSTSLEDVKNVADLCEISISTFNTEDCTEVGDNSSHNSIICELCGSINYSKSDYRAHLSSHSSVRLYQCKFCPKRFTRAESRQNHMRAHLGIRPFVCEICGRSSTKRQDLVRHMKIHSDERNHVCNTCGRSFKRGMDLISHNRTHTGARPYKCATCYKEYTSHSGLRKHRKQHVLCREQAIKT